MSPPALLDTSVLIALFDGAHLHHNVAHDWFADNRSRGWATAPATENALIRIVSNPAYGRNAERPLQLAARLRTFCGAADHLFWTDTVSLADDTVFDLAFSAHRHLTDVYLLGLARAHHGVLATFDRTIPANAIVNGTPDLLEIIGA